MLKHCWFCSGCAAVGKVGACTKMFCQTKQAPKCNAFAAKKDEKKEEAPKQEAGNSKGSTVTSSVNKKPSSTDATATAPTTTAAAKVENNLQDDLSAAGALRLSSLLGFAAVWLSSRIANTGC